MPPNKSQIYQQIYNVLDKADKILVVSHIRPDGDAFGSLVAFYRFLNQDHKSVRLFINDDSFPAFHFLPHFNRIENDYYSFLEQKFEALIALDCGDFSRSGLADYWEKISYQPPLINIDHHGSNDNFGNYNLVNTQSSSTSEIIYDFLKYRNIKIDPLMATALLTGIITDTEFFVNPNTTHQSLKYAGELISAGAKLNLILNNVTKNFSVKGLKLWGKALARLYLDPKNNLATTAIFKDDLEEVRVSEDELSGLANFLNVLSDAKGAMILREESANIIKGSLRTMCDDIDVSQIAKEYGGGGHKKAAGFKIRGRLIRGNSGAWEIEQV